MGGKGPEPAVPRTARPPIAIPVLCEPHRSVGRSTEAPLAGGGRGGGGFRRSKGRCACGGLGEGPPPPLFTSNSSAAASPASSMNWFRTTGTGSGRLPPAGFPAHPPPPQPGSSARGGVEGRD
eukprot:1182689-Prorocentrum_minimum.AAC.4